MIVNIGQGFHSIWKLKSFRKAELYIYIYFYLYVQCLNLFYYLKPHNKKSRVRETKHLLTDVDSSTDAIGR